VALDPRSPLHRFRVDARAVLRQQVDRLVDLGVALVEIPPVRARPLLARFVREFLDPSRSAEIAAEIARPQGASRALDFDHWLRPECVRDSAAGCGGWLFPAAVDPSGAECLRFERRPDLPALAIDLTTMNDAWAASWPGVFVRFDVGRAVVVTLDYEQIRCEVRPSGPTPYR
jgi:hypothetical protein